MAKQAGIIKLKGVLDKPIMASSLVRHSKWQFSIHLLSAFGLHQILELTVLDTFAFGSRPQSKICFRWAGGV